MSPEQPQKSRPSFTTFWKKSKQILQGNRVEFVQQGKQIPPAGSSEFLEENDEDDSSKALSKSEKAKVRRAQVRRAQIQHRQRKVEYVKQLELDVTHFRELIALTDGESAQLKKQNAAMRAQLQRIGVTIQVTMPSKSENQSAPMGIEARIDRLLQPDQQSTDLVMSDAPSLPDPAVQQPELAPEMFADINIDDVVVTLKKDEQLHTPVFSVSSSPSDSNTGNSNLSSTASPPSPRTTPPTSPATSVSVSLANADLSQTQEQMAINFILTMEHICWDHFWLGDYPGHHHHSDEFKGHTLMASTFCMASAPDDVYEGRSQVSDSTPCKTRRAVSIDPYFPPVTYEWSSPRISLAALHGLASSLNAGDKELTPVQAWFELAGKYPKETLLNPGLLSWLSCELNGVVKCLEFGAVMERGAFESVVGRVLGPALDEMIPQMGIEQVV